MALTPPVEAEAEIEVEGTGDLATRRFRRAAATSAVAIVARSVGVAGNLLLVPLTLGYLGEERYGVWATVLSLVALVSLSDLGIGNALVSRIATADAEGRPDHAARDLSTALVVFCAIAAALLAAFAATFGVIPWHDVFNLAPGDDLVDEARRAAAVLVVIVLARLPADIVVNVRRGYQQGYVNAWFEIVAGVSKVALVALAVRLDLGLPWLVLAASGGMVVASLVNWVLMVRARPELRPHLGAADRATASALVRSGGLFLSLQIVSIVAFSADNFVAAQVLGPAAVTQYAVPSQVTLAAIGVIGLLSAPLWPAYAEALARHDHPWVLRTLSRSLLLCGGVGLGTSIVLLAFGRPLIEVWSRGEVVPSLSLLLGLCVWIVLATTGMAVAMFMNANGVVRFQVVCGGLMATSNIVLSVVLARRIGVAGLIWGTDISYALFMVIPYATYLVRWRRSVLA